MHTRRLLLAVLPLILLGCSTAYDAAWEKLGYDRDAWVGRSNGYTGGNWQQSNGTRTS